jgi:hypothetical protein
MNSYHGFCSLLPGLKDTCRTHRITVCLLLVSSYQIYCILLPGLVITVARFFVVVLQTCVMCLVFKNYCVIVARLFIHTFQVHLVQLPNCF